MNINKILSNLNYSKIIDDVNDKEIYTKNEIIIEFFVFLFISYFLVSKFYFPINNACNYQISPFISNEIAQIKTFTDGINQNLKNPFKIQSTLCYNCTTNFHFLTAYNSVLLFRCCYSLQLSIKIPTIFMLHSSFYIAFLLMKLIIFNSTSIKQFSDKNKNHLWLLFLSWTSFIFMMNAGGLGFLAFLSYPGRFNPQTDYVTFITSQISTYWMHPIILYFLAHRSSQLSFSLSLCSLYLLYLYTLTNNKQKRKKFFQFIGLLSSLLLSIDYICFLSMMLFILIFLLIFLYGDHIKQFISKIIHNQNEQNNEKTLSQKIIFKDLYSFLIIFIPIFILQIILIRPFTYEQGTRYPFVFFEKSWENFLNELPVLNIFIYWFRNIGFFFILSLFSFIGLDKTETIFYISSSFIFVFNNFVHYSYYYPDNSLSLFPFWCSFQSVFIVMLLVRFIEKFGTTKTNNDEEIIPNEIKQTKDDEILIKQNKEKEIIKRNSKEDKEKKKEKIILNSNDETSFNNNNKNTIVYGIVFVLYISMILSSLTGIIYNPDNITKLFDESDVIISEYIKTEIPTDSVFLVPLLSRNRNVMEKRRKRTSFNFAYYHLPPPLLSGRTALQGDTLLTYLNGFNWDLYTEQINELKNQPDNETILPFVDYIFIDDDKEKNSNPNNSDFTFNDLSNSTQWKLVYSYKDLHLFKRIIEK